LAIGLGRLPLLLRAARWRLLLQAQAPVSFRTTFWAVAAGYFGNSFLPARGGEVLRSHLIQSRSSLSLSYVLATALSERVADAVALIVIGAIVSRFAPHASRWMNKVSISLSLIGLTAIAALSLLPLLKTPLDRLLAGSPKLRTIVQQTLLGIRSLHHAKRLAQFAALTAVIWFLDAVATSTLARSLSIVMPLSLAMLLIVGLSLSSALPATPGYVGIYQFVAVTVLKPFGVSPSSAIAFILFTQALDYIIITALGLLAITRYTPFNWRFVRRPLHPIQIQN